MLHFTNSIGIEEYFLYYCSTLLFIDLGAAYLAIVIGLKPDSDIEVSSEKVSGLNGGFGWFSNCV